MAVSKYKGIIFLKSFQWAPLTAPPPTDRKARNRTGSGALFALLFVRCWGNLGASKSSVERTADSV